MYSSAKFGLVAPPSWVEVIYDIISLYMGFHGVPWVKVKVHIAYAVEQPAVTRQYKFGTSASWEGNRRSGVALAMRHRFIHLRAQRPKTEMSI